MKSLIKHRIPFVEKWLTLPKGYHWAFFLFCLSAVNFSVVLDYWEERQKLQNIHVEITRQATELAHQQKLLAAMKQHSERHALSPKLTKQIVALDQQINDFLNREIEVSAYQWDFSSRPILQIQVEGRFQDLHQFLTALLTQQNALSFAQLAMEKSENGRVLGNFILQLKNEE
ncbi:hypothetical protein [Rodentibacter myodis]|uniref:Competence protein C n=1 Tax=Rodentibacter myodis TaxID=1907939 RepID=A0A1V3JKY8_9PAST|nr:hypothetical protein [Rodentibacter myodis]OOF57440.1 hypothetical protein BKL49_09055 [Rodentibacter myodis]